MNAFLCLQESVEDMGLYEDVSGAGGDSVQVTVTSLLHMIYANVEILTCSPLCSVMVSMHMFVPHWYGFLKI